MLKLRIFFSFNRLSYFPNFSFRQQLLKNEFGELHSLSLKKNKHAKIKYSTKLKKALWQQIQSHLKYSRI